MTGKELVLSGFDFQQDEKYLYARAYKKVADKISEKKFQADQNIIMQLTDAHIKKFGGSFLDIHDQKRGLSQVMKLVNLGLENTCKKGAGKNETEAFDMALAENIVSKAPLISVYQIGKKLFNERCESVRKLLERSEIEMLGYYFRLISEAEYDALAKALDLELMRGSQEEHESISCLMAETETKLSFFPLLPIHEKAIYYFVNFGSCSKGKYPVQTGLIDCVLSSLLVACMFREERDLFQKRKDSKVQDEFRKLVMKEGISEETREYYLQSVLNQSRIMRRDEQARFDSREKWISFFADVLVIRDAEVGKFSDMLFFEPDEFRKNVERIEGLFCKFFDVYAKELQVKKPKGFARALKKALVQTEKRIVREAVEFYKSAKDAEVSPDDVKKFWSGRVIIESDSIAARNEEIALRSEEGISPEKLAEMASEYIVSATAHFHAWSEEKKRIFIEKLNPNRFFPEKYQPVEDFTKFLQNISTEKMAQSSFEKDASGKKDVAVFKEKTVWAEKVLGKIGWEHLHPSIAAAIWGESDTETRNALFALRDRIKVSLPSFKDYYLQEQDDPRLFAYVLDRLIRGDKIKTKKMLKSLVHDARNIPVIRSILSTRYEEAKDGLK